MNVHTQPFPPMGGNMDPYGDHFGDERMSISSGHSTGRYTSQSRQILTVS